MQTIRVSPDWTVTPDNYQIDYFIGERSMHFMANAEQMAEICLNTQFITQYEGTAVITFDPDEPERDVQMELVDFVSSWNQRTWIDFITSYEQSKMFGAEYTNAINKYKVA